MKRTRIPASAERVFRWHERPDALTKLIPPGDPVKVLEHKGGIRDGARVVLAIGYGPFRIRWIALHRNYVEGRQFQDVQIKGPFRSWEHTHTITPAGPEACDLEDRVVYELPLGWLGRLAGAAIARRKLEAMFRYRHQVTLRENA